MRTVALLDEADPETFGSDDCLHCLISRTVLKYRKENKDTNDGSIEMLANSVCQVLAEMAVTNNQGFFAVVVMLRAWYNEIKAEVGELTGNHEPGTPFGHA